MWVLIEECFAGNDKSGRAESALGGVMVNESLLNRVQLATLHQRFNRSDLLALRLDCQHRARVNRLVVDHHRAGSAFTAVADAFSTGDVETVTQRVKQRDPRFHLQLCLLTVNG